VVSIQRNARKLQRNATHAAYGTAGRSVYAATAMNARKVAYATNAVDATAKTQGHCVRRVRCVAL